MEDPTPPARYFVQAGQVYIAVGERIGWVAANGYIYACHPTAWLTPHPPVIDQDPTGRVWLWGKRVGADERQA
jgi:hypothetical protein